MFKKTLMALMMGSAIAFAGVSTAAMAQSVETGTTVTHEKKIEHKKAQKKEEGVYKSRGVVKTVGNGKVEIKHPAVKAAKLSKGTTSFSIEGYKGTELKVGEKVSFRFREAKSGLVLVSAKVVPAKKAAHQKAEKAQQFEKSTDKTE